MTMVWFIKKQKKQDPVKKELDDVETYNAEIRRIRRQIKLEREKIELERIRQEYMELRGDDDLIDDPAEMTPESTFQQMLMMMMLKNQNGLNPSPQQTTGLGGSTIPLNATQQFSTPSEPPKPPVYSVDEFKALWDTLPKAVRKRLKKADDDNLKRLIPIHLPNIDEQGIKNAIEFIKSQ